MQKTKFFIVSFLSLCLQSCMAISANQYSAPPQPSMTQVQGECLAAFKTFLEQTGCIQNYVNSANLPPNAFVQEYLAYMQDLQRKVKLKTLSESQARIKLTSKLSEGRARQQNERAAQEQIENERLAQDAEILRRYQAGIQRPEPFRPVVVNPTPIYPIIQNTPYTAPKVESSLPARPLVIECRGVANQGACTSQHY